MTVIDQALPVSSVSNIFTGSLNYLYCTYPLSLEVIPEMPSYSVRCVFEWPPRDQMVLAHLYEERITLWKASSLDEAIEFAEAEAEEYASENEFKYIEFAQAFWLSSEVDVDGVEVFSLLRESNMAPEHYLNIFQDTGYERSTEAPS